MRDRILALLQERPGLTGREVAEALFGAGAPQPRANGALQSLAAQGRIVRRPERGVLRCYLAESAPEARLEPEQQSMLSEDWIKERLRGYLSNLGYEVQIAMGREHGIDIDARRDTDRWIIEVKGCGSLSAMRVNYFLMILGETLQRMSDSAARYSIALPDMPQYRRLWERLPKLAKQRTSITCLFVCENGQVEECI